MHIGNVVLAAVIAAGHAAAVAHAQEAPTASIDTAPTAVVTAPPAPAPSDAPASPPCPLRAGTALELEIIEPLSSALRQRGDRFPLRLRAPVTCGDATVIPADAVGVGEIVHAERSRGGGKPGELLIAARYLESGGVQWRLRGLKLGGQGQDNSKAALAAALAIGPFAHFIRGREIEIPAGTLVIAKLAQEVPLAAAAPVSEADAAPASNRSTESVQQE